MNWTNWLPTLQGFLFGLAAFFALFCLMISDGLHHETFFHKFGRRYLPPSARSARNPRASIAFCSIKNPAKARLQALIVNRGT
jgi:hypothetical protein